MIENSNNNGNIVYSVQWGNVYTCHKIYNYLYKGANIYLDRKLEKFDSKNIEGVIGIASDLIEYNKKRHEERLGEIKNG